MCFKFLIKFKDIPISIFPHFRQDLNNFLIKLLKFSGLELLNEITKFLYISKSRSPSVFLTENTNNKTHYNGVVRSYSLKLDNMRKSLKEEEEEKKGVSEDLEYQELNEFAFSILKSLFDLAVSDIEVKERRIYVDYIENSKIVKVIELIDSTVLFNQKLVRKTLWFI